MTIFLYYYIIYGNKNIKQDGENFMDILKRFKDIMSANINALLDKAENPEKMIDQYIRDIESDLGKVKAETASIMANEKKAKRELDECSEEIEKMQKYAEKALLAGNENDARLFLQKKNSLENEYNSLKQNYDIAVANSEKMKEMHDKLVKDMASLKDRRDAIKAKMAMAKAQEKMNKMGSSISGISNSMSNFDKMEEKANRMYDEAVTMSELNKPVSDGIDELMAKYDDNSSTDSKIDDELSALKAKMGL